MVKSNWSYLVEEFPIYDKEYKNKVSWIAIINKFNDDNFELLIKSLDDAKIKNNDDIDKAFGYLIDAANSIR
jgi:hypothetical protein